MWKTNAEQKSVRVRVWRRLFRRYIQRSSLVKNLNPKTVVVFGGVNNLNRLIWKKKFKIFYTQLIDSLLETTKTICLISLTPTRKPCKISNTKIITASNIISDVAKIKSCIFLDIYSLFQNNGDLNLAIDNGDGIHLNKKAYALISIELKKEIRILNSCYYLFIDLINIKNLASFMI